MALTPDTNTFDIAALEDLQDAIALGKGEITEKWFQASDRAALLSPLIHQCLHLFQIGNKKDLDLAWQQWHEINQAYPDWFMTHLLKAHLLENEKAYLPAFVSHLRALGTHYDHRKPLRRLSKYITGYSSILDHGLGYRLRIEIQPENNEVIHEYLFDPLFLSFMEEVNRHVTLRGSQIIFQENSRGILFNYFFNYGLNATGVTTSEDVLESVYLNHFSIRKREKFQGLWPHLMLEQHLPDPSQLEAPYDIGVWVVLNHPQWQSLSTEEKIQELIHYHQYSITTCFCFSQSDEDNLLIKMLKQECSRRHKNGNSLYFQQKTFSHQQKKWTLCMLSSTSTPLEKGYKTVSVIPRGLKIIHSPSHVFEVNVEKCRDKNGFSYVEGGHYFAETLRQYEKNPQLTYDQSYLRFYYEHFQPANAQERCLWMDGQDHPPLSLGWPPDPWSERPPKPVREERGETRSGGNHNMGPNTDKFGKAEFQRIITAYNYLKTQGYRPEFFLDGFITGTLLVNHNDYRFVVNEGQHRIAALAALKYSIIRCRLNIKQPASQQVIYRSSFSQWPQVKQGMYSPTAAQQFFDHYFDPHNNLRLLKHLSENK